MRMKYLDASENLSLSFLSYLSILKIENGGWVLQLLYLFSPSLTAVLVIMAVVRITDSDSGVELLSVYSYKW